MGVHPRSRGHDDPENGINGICLRGKAGWGEGGAFIT
jgi:sorbitol/mannitol transport system substrate-binding protein